MPLPDLTRAHLKEHLNMINCIRRMVKADRAQLAAVLGYSWPKVENDLKSDLLTTGIAIREGNQFLLNAKLGCFLGIAVGTREIKIVVIDFSFCPIANDKILELVKETCDEPFIQQFAQLKQQSPENSYFSLDSSQKVEVLAQQLNYVLDLILRLHEYALDGFTLLGIGICFSGAVDYLNRRIQSSQNIPALSGKRVENLISGSLLKKIEQESISLSVDHNGKAAMIFEKEHLYTSEDAAYRRLCNKPNAAVVYIGTGVGMGLIQNNRLLRGSSNYLGELGHIQAPCFDLEAYGDEVKEKKSLMNPHDVRCSCGRDDCLEAQIRSLVFGASNITDFQKNTTEALLQTFSQDQPYRYRLLKRYIGYIINLLVNLLNLDLIIFTGRVFRAIPPLRDELNVILEANTLSFSGQSCTILLGSGLTNASALGIAMRSCFDYCAQAEAGLFWPVIPGLDG